MASIIDPEKAKSLISEYRTQNSSAGGPALKTPEGAFLHGFYVNRESLEAMLSNPKVTGVSVHLAKHPDAVGTNNNHFTLVMAGAEPNTAEGATTRYVNSGDYYDQLPQCPPYC